jgi:hypothetical protein
MVTEERIRELAYTLWEQDGKPEGKNEEHYYSAKRVLEELEAAQITVASAASKPATRKRATSGTAKKAAPKAATAAPKSTTRRRRSNTPEA